jgi:hypothetical protein
VGRRGGLQVQRETPEASTTSWVRLALANSTSTRGASGAMLANTPVAAISPLLCPGASS